MAFNSTDFLELPEEPEEAFVALHDKLMRSIRNTSAGVQTKAKSVYINTMIAFDEVHELGFLNNSLSGKNTEEMYDNFLARVDAIILRIEIRKAKKMRLSVIPCAVMEQSAKEVAHKLIATLRSKIEQLDISEAKKDSLLAKLNAFSAELDQSHTRVEALFAFVVEVSRVGKTVGATFAPIKATADRLLDIVERFIPSSKQIESSPKPKQLEAPDEDIREEDGTADNITDQA